MFRVPIARQSYSCCRPRSAFLVSASFDRAATERADRNLAAASPSCTIALEQVDTYRWMTSTAQVGNADPTCPKCEALRRILRLCALLAQQLDLGTGVACPDLDIDGPTNRIELTPTCLNCLRSCRRCSEAPAFVCRPLLRRPLSVFASSCSLNKCRVRRA